MNPVTTHYYPNAMLIFVSSYQKDKNNTPDYVIASNIGNVKEISSIKVSLTVKASPGTLNATIVNTGGKFYREDDPEEEIPILYNYSNNKKRINISSLGKQVDYPSYNKETTQTAKDFRIQSISTKAYKTKTVDEPGNFYEFKSYKDWKNFEHYIFEDKKNGKRYPLFYNRNSSGDISEYWTFDEEGKIIVFDDPFLLQHILNHSSFSMDVDGETRVFTLHKYSNKFFTDDFKDKTIQGITSKYRRGKCRIEPMDRVICFMSKRFVDNDLDMERVFTGVVNSVEDSYSGNEEIINIQAEDVTKYMRISYINVNPALLLGKELDINQTPDQKITVWTTILKGLTAPDIIRLVTLGGNYLLKKTPNTQNIDGIEFYDIGGTPKIGTRIRVSSEDGSFVEVDGKGNRRKISIRQMLGALFTTSTVHVVDPFRNKNTHLKGFRPYELSLSTSWSYYQGEWKTRREIADRVAEDTHFVFYADKNGEIWFHPPRFSNAWILGNENPKTYVIDTDSIISYGFIESDQNIYSSVYVSTEPDFGYDSLSSYGWYQKSVRDDGVTLKYGQRFFTASNPIINTKDRRDQSIIAYAKSLLQRLLAGKYQGQVTITGRPEINQGMPVYIPLVNRIYYAESIDHNFNFGGQFTTTLSLSYGRKPWEYLPELMSFSANDEVYMTDAALFRDYTILTSEDNKNIKNPK